MNFFNQIVTETLKDHPHLAPLKMVVERELLHYDIIYLLNHLDLLSSLTFIGGACLRRCYGGIRLSADLDFTGGSDLTQDSLSQMGQMLVASLENKYKLAVKISELVKEQKNVDTWKIKIETRPEQKSAQRINIDICAVPSYEKRPMLLLNPYSTKLQNSGLILQVQSREEIYADKLLAFAFRPNRIKYRDLWDIIWLNAQGVKPRLGLIPDKVRDQNQSVEEFLQLFHQRRKALTESDNLAWEFKQEMLRFLPQDLIDNMLDQQNSLWIAIVHLIEDLDEQVHSSLSSKKT